MKDLLTRVLDAGLDLDGDALPFPATRRQRPGLSAIVSEPRGELKGGAPSA